MSDIWAPVIAALGASLLTVLGAFVVEGWRARKAGKAAAEEQRSQAYAALLIQSTYLMQLALNLHLIMQFRSGLQEGLHVTIGMQKPIDVVAFSEKMGNDMKPLYDAWTKVWMVGSKEAIAQANDLVAQCGTVISLATQHGTARPDWLRRVIGEKWTKAQLDEWEKAQRELAAARKRFAELARKEAGAKAVDLFVSYEITLSTQAVTKH